MCFPCFSVGQDVSWVGILCWPDMVLNQRQVLVIVSDWEPYLGSLGSTVGLWVFVSCVSVFATRDCFGLVYFTLLFCIS